MCYFSLNYSLDFMTFRMFVLVQRHFFLPSGRLAKCFVTRKECWVNLFNYSHTSLEEKKIKGDFLNCDQEKSLARLICEIQPLYYICH